MEGKLSLVFVNMVGVNHEGKYEYEFYYSDTPDTVWAEDFAEQAPSTCLIDDLIPDGDTYNMVKRGVSRTKFELVQKNSCFSVQDCMDGIISLIWVYDSSDNRYHGLSYGESEDVADAFLENNGVEFTETIEVNKDKGNNYSDDVFDTDGGLVEEEYDE